MIWQRLSRYFALIGMAWSVVMFITLIFLPLYRGISQSPEGGPAVTSTATLIQVNGYWVLILLAIPALLGAGIALPILRSRHIWGFKRALVWISTALLLIFVILSGFSIGLFYFPSAILALVASILAEVNISKSLRAPLSA